MKSTMPVQPTPPDNEYVPLLESRPMARAPAKLICFYLPQFHAIPENDAWWGSGFTEWVNVKASVPQFPGHHQPEVPGELGYYDLRDAGVQRRQIELAKLYGIGGFCFFFYWFAGKCLLETPVRNYLDDMSLDLPFCLCWANENWTRRWDGLENDVLIAQEHSNDDDLAFISHVARYMRDVRYIRVDGKPLLTVYRPSLLPDASATALRWRDWCRANGIGEIFLACTQSFEAVDPGIYGFDAAIEFPPNNSAPPNITDRMVPAGSAFSGHVFDWNIFEERSRNLATPGYAVYRSVCPSWDNTPRRKGNSIVFANSSPAGFRSCLENVIRETRRRIPRNDERLIFVNAWNEWGEGAHLEPDARRGYAWLQAVRDALEAQLAEEERLPDRVVLVSHQAHPPETRYVGVRFAQAISRTMGCEIELVSLGEEPIADGFPETTPRHIITSGDADDAVFTRIAGGLFARGFRNAIVSATASGQLLQAYGQQVAALAHSVDALQAAIKDHEERDANHRLALQENTLLLQERTNSLIANEQAIALLEAAIAEKSRELGDRDRLQLALDERTRSLEISERRIAQLEATVVAKNQELDTRDQLTVALRDQTRSLEACEQRVALLESMVVEKNQDLHERKRLLSEHESAILASKPAGEALATAIAEHQRNAVTMQAAATTAAQQAATADTMLRSLQMKIEQLSSQLAMSEARERSSADAARDRALQIAHLDTAVAGYVNLENQMLKPAFLARKLPAAVATTVHQSTASLAGRNPWRWKKLTLELQPLHQILALGEGRYTSLGRDPQFLVVPHDGVFPAEWFLCRISGRNERNAVFAACFYVDTGDGFKEVQKRDIHFVSGPGISERWVRLPEGTRNLRFDPMDREGNFSIDTFEMIDASRTARAARLVAPYVKRTLIDPRYGIKAIRTGSRLFRQDGLRGLKARIITRAQALPTEYAQWVALFDTTPESALASMRKNVAGWHAPPMISVLMPVYNPPPQYLNDAIESVRAQVYPHWELCIADDKSTNPEIRALLERHAAADQRIKLVFRPENGHISAASNSALDAATGEFVALLDHDDMLPAHSLYWLADALIGNPDTGVVYTDEDKIDAMGRRYDPYFKCGWNATLFRGQNMFCHLSAFRTSLVRSVGGFRSGFEGAQDYDLALRCVEQLRPAQIVHVPRVLYHWRAIPGSTAMAGNEKPYAMIAGQRAVQEHLDRLRIKARVETLPFGHYRVRYALPDKPPLVSLIIPTHNGHKYLRQCIESIRTKTTYRNFDIVVVDNRSDNPDTLAYLAQLASQAGTTVLRDGRPFNFSAINNAAVEQARGEYVCLMNDDVEVIAPDWLDEMMSLAIQARSGAIGARLWYPDNTLQHGGVILGVGGVAGHSHKHLPKGHLGYSARAALTQSLSAVTAACMLVKKSIYLEVGGLDEQNLGVAFNDVDFCLKLLEKDYDNLWTPFAELYHYESASRGYEDTPEKQARFKGEIDYMLKRWDTLLGNDPAYNPNLTIEREDFSLAWPPRVAMPAP